MNDKIDKSMTQEDLLRITHQLKAMETKFINEVKLFLTFGSEEGEGNIYTMDLFASAIVNRAISTIHGFLLLAEDNNYISAVPLIRLQLDNCMRFYASTLVEDYNEFYLKYLGGSSIRDLKDAKGKNLTDNYLARQLDNNVKAGVLKLYKNTSGYIHFSNEHSFLHAEVDEKEERTIRTRIGRYDFFQVYHKVDFAYNMLVVTDLLLDLVKSWKFQKVKSEQLNRQSISNKTT